MGSNSSMLSSNTFGKNLSTVGVIEMKVPKYVTYFEESVPEGTKFIISFVGGNMKKVLLGIVFCLILLFSYLIYTFANNNTTTYIEYTCNSDFIIGINKDNHINQFIPLNDKASEKYNLNLIEEKSLLEFGELYEDIERIKDKEVKVTISL